MTKRSSGRASTEEKEILRRQRISETMKRNKKSGGIRQGSGRGKKGWYKGVFCDSTYELVFVIYCKDHEIPIKRSELRYKYFYNGDYHYYYPDFQYPAGNLVEIKGYRTEQVEAKIKAVTDRPITVLYEKDLKFAFDWVYSHYKFDSLEDLYENKKKKYVKPIFIFQTTNKKKVQTTKIKKIPPTEIKRTCLWCGEQFTNIANTERQLKYYMNKTCCCCSHTFKYKYYGVSYTDAKQIGIISNEEQNVHTAETRVKMSKLKIGSKNNQYGKHWFYNPETLESICCFDAECPNEYIRGRKLLKP